MLVHSVLFWLRPDLSPADRNAFRAGLESLRAAKTVESLYIGCPAPTPDRPVIDRSYAFALTIVFKDVAAHDAYQVDPLHLAFVENHKAKWTRVQIYDAA
ncbi:transcription-repair coupling factor [Opitutaceae bacterium EW11]|nr:transcription-repair coupling factor [Opitutaceae bacterium EW11]